MDYHLSVILKNLKMYKMIVVHDLQKMVTGDVLDYRVRPTGCPLSVDVTPRTNFALLKVLLLRSEELVFPVTKTSED